MSSVADLAGGDAEVNRKIIESVFNGEIGPCADIVILNAAAALYVAGIAESIKEGVAAARSSINNFAARKKLNELIVYPVMPKI